MEVNFKYSIGESVWMMHSDEPAIFQVVEASIKSCRVISYTLTGPFTAKGGVLRTTNFSGVERLESQVFKTKQELIKSL